MKNLKILKGPLKQEPQLHGFAILRYFQAYDRAAVFNEFTQVITQPGIIKGHIEPVLISDPPGQVIQVFDAVAGYNSKEGPIAFFMGGD